MVGPPIAGCQTHLCVFTSVSTSASGGIASQPTRLPRPPAVNWGLHPSGESVHHSNLKMLWGHLD